jgi:hypothetical protein
MKIIRRTLVGASTLGLIASLLTGAFAQAAELPKRNVLTLEAAQRRRSLRDRGRNSNATGEGPVIIAECVRRGRRRALWEQTDRQCGPHPSSTARLRRSTDPKCGCRGY